MAKETERYRPSGSLEPTNAIRGERYERRHQVRMNGKASDKIKSVLKEISKHGYSRRRPFVVNFLYAYSFPHRINMEKLIDLGVLLGVNDAPRGFKPITKEQFETILKETKSDESFIID